MILITRNRLATRGKHSGVYTMEQVTIAIRPRQDSNGYVFICTERVSTLSRGELEDLRDKIDSLLWQEDMDVQIAAQLVEEK